MGLSFELADLQGQNNQSQNYPSPGKGYQAGKPSDTIGAIPDKASRTAYCFALSWPQERAGNVLGSPTKLQ